MIAFNVDVKEIDDVMWWNKPVNQVTSGATGDASKSNKNNEREFSAMMMKQPSDKKEGEQCDGSKDKRCVFNRMKHTESATGVQSVYKVKEAWYDFFYRAYAGHIGFNQPFGKLVGKEYKNSYNDCPICTWSEERLFHRSYFFMHFIQTVASGIASRRCILIFLLHNSQSPYEPLSKRSSA